MLVAKHEPERPEIEKSIPVVAASVSLRIILSDVKFDPDCGEYQAHSSHVMQRIGLTLRKIIGIIYAWSA